ncbi:MAG: NapC/NirT family cytochrome c [Deltaproteobacteria bacterium]|jgi:nitrate/TMAO reductase-like tetraheme cytochrome c subunit|nr:NapC/NirT family cytochrome c [Deltaproteobacteria bacterium]
MSTTPRQIRITLLGVGILLVAGIVATAAFFSFSSTTSFCTSCHEMNVHKEELAQSPHAKDYDESAIDCADCHLPRGLGPRYLSVKTYLGVKDVFVHFTESPDSIDRRHSQPVARRFVDDASCQACHDDLYKDAKKEKDISEIGKLAHDNYNGKDGKSYRLCVDCHTNMAHLPSFDRRLDINQEFAAKLVAAEQLVAAEEQGGAQ